MGLLASIAKKIMINPVMDFALTAFAHPIQIAKAIVGPTTIKQVTQAHFAQPMGKQLTEVAMSGINIGTMVAGGAAIKTAAKAGTLVTAVKTLLPTTIKGKVVAAVAAPVVLGAVISQPAKVIGAVAKTPAALANIGGNIANAAANPSIANIKAIFTENPVIAGGVVALGAIAGAKTLLPAVVTARQIEATQEQTKAIAGATAAMGGGVSVKDYSQLSTQPLAPTTPTLPQTKTTTAQGVTTKRRKKRSLKAILPNISQRVNVLVSNRNSTIGIKQSKKYIRKEVYA